MSLEGLLLFDTLDRTNQINQKNLETILRDNADTEYGKKFGFAQIRDLEDFRRKLPLTQYEDYPELCKEGKYTAYPFSYILETSGSTGGTKLFPLTKQSLERYGWQSNELPNARWGVSKGPHLFASLMRIPKNGVINLSSAHHLAMMETGHWNPESYAGGYDLLFSDKISDIPYVRVWLALSCPNAVSIQSIFLYDMLCMMNYLEQNWRGVLSDMRNGEVSAALDESVKEKLLRLLPDNSVLDRDERILSEGFSTPIIPRLWENVAYISGIGGSSLDFQTDSLRRYCGTLPIYYLVYGSSECMMGISPEPDKAEYMFISDAAYYEFMDEDGNWADIDKLEIGKAYEPVITTFSGLYRYRMGDLLLIRSYREKMPIFEVLGRKYTFNIAGEKISETTIKIAVRKWVEKLSVQLFDYSVGVEYETVPGGYIMFLEHDGELPADAGAKLDKILMELDPDYAKERTGGLIKPLEIAVCEKGTLSGLVGFDKGHRKHHVFLTHEQTSGLLKQSNE